VDFDTIEAGLSRAGEGLGKGADQSRHFIRSEAPRRACTNIAQLAIRAVGKHIRMLRPFLGHTPRSLAIRHERPMRHPADVPYLQKYRPVISVNFIGPQTPALPLGLRVDARR